MADVERIAVSICRGFRSGIPFLRLGADGRELVLAHRRRGEIIDDPDCDQQFEALESLVFRRYPASVDGQDTFRWLGVCPLDEEAVEALLRLEVGHIEDAELEAMPSDVVWQVHQWTEGRERNARRLAARAAREELEAAGPRP